MLKNGSFEGGWIDVPAGSTINQEPKHWRLSWRTVGAPLTSIEPDLPGDTESVVQTVPECVHQLASQLPPRERPTGEDPLILDGRTVYKVFAAYGAFSARLEATIEAEPGAVVSVTVPVRVHQHGNGDYGAAYWRATLGATVGAWLTFKRDFDDCAWTRCSLQARLPESGLLTLAIEFESHTIAGIDFFIDDVRAEVVDEPQPEPNPCRGAPREQYHRVYWLLPQHATLEQFKQACELAYPTRGTVGFSADDAGIGDLNGRDVRVLWFSGGDWDRDALDDFFARYYPGVSVVHEALFDPTEPEKPPPEPEPYRLRSRNLIGLHAGFYGEKTMDYIIRARPTCQKFFSAGDCYAAKEIAPNMITVWRKYVGNEKGRIWEHQTIRDAAIWYMDQYSLEIEAAARGLEVSVADVLAGIDAIESLNETIGSFEPDLLQQVVEFDVLFAEELHRRYGDALRPVLLNGAIGNPHESEVHYLVPAAEAVVKYNGFIGYHCYWTHNEERSFLEEHWRYHAGRWTEWDKVFTAAGLHPRYLSTEGGIVYAHDGENYESGRGWRACGSFEVYLRDIDLFNRKAWEWNAQHANRFAGLTLFCYPFWGWDSFVLGDGDVDALIAWAEGL